MMIPFGGRRNKFESESETETDCQVLSEYESDEAG